MARINSRSKGARGELEMAKLLGDALGIIIKRNINQVRDGGYDLRVEGWSIECKRCQQLQISTWWAQAVKSAQDVGMLPALAYRRNHEQWKVMLRLGELAPEFSSSEDHLATISLETFIEVIKKRK